MAISSRQYRLPHQCAHWFAMTTRIGNAVKYGKRRKIYYEIVRRVDDLGRIVIPKEIRRTLKIREGDPSYTTLAPIDRFCMAIHSVVERIQLFSKD